ncbi:hypothetical protein EPVG_00378 [Emiliania huxleyi virus 201]|nr:hypothetical protein ELVG_00003 [Emiliania huxleyi virus 203]AEP15413.1 hypothetical protein EQVG_00003 [Emiliania huxleyi virus 207]AEP16048.1 hypothetical protein ERVG_00172 [Emiliania huxleyi virus 208]AET98265.1 hypothetical protein EPVG_00378 [Emiliania huxleyi virus 201]
MSYPFAIYWKMRYIEIIIYFIVLTTLFTLSFVPTISSHKGYKISLQVLMGIGVYMSFMTFVFATHRRYKEYPVLVMQTNGLLWPREYGTHY